MAKLISVSAMSLIVLPLSQRGDMHPAEQLAALERLRDGMRCDMDGEALMLLEYKISELHQQKQQPRGNNNVCF